MSASVTATTVEIFVNEKSMGKIPCNVTHLGTEEGEMEDMIRWQDYDDEDCKPEIGDFVRTKGKPMAFQPIAYGEVVEVRDNVVIVLLEGRPTAVGALPQDLQVLVVDECEETTPEDLVGDIVSWISEVQIPETLTKDTNVALGFELARQTIMADITRHFP